MINPMNASPLITRFIDLMNTRDGEAFLTAFTPGAIVHDEGHTHQGPEAIRAWIEKAWATYQPHLELRNVESTGPDTAFTGQVSGTFDGSPVLLRHHLTVADEKIAELRIGPVE